ncbi:DNA utilization protein GntX [Moellerella wisconsensis]|uniref:DNA utilization protein GntX n=1 Tax=Moellerella wisconsensis TaxID=158849 RepID=UPI0030767DB6
MLAIEGYCWLCHQRLKLPCQGICSFCYRQLPSYPPACSRCAQSIEYNKITCGECLVTPPAWQKLIAVTPYIAPLRNLIQQYKFHPHPQLSHTLARLFVLHWLHGYRQLKWNKPNIIIGIPLHRRRRWQRGFDQVNQIGELIAKWLNIEYSSELLTRSRDTLTQTTLNRTQRQRNLQHAFSLHGSVQERHIALFDDVITTGTTMNSAAELLICAGASTVQAWSICRTL